MRLLTLLFAVLAGEAFASPVELRVPHLIDPAALGDELRAAGVSPEKFVCDEGQCIVRIKDSRQKEAAQAVISAHKYRSFGERAKEREGSERQELLSLRNKLRDGTISAAERDGSWPYCSTDCCFPDLTALM